MIHRCLGVSLALLLGACAMAPSQPIAAADRERDRRAILAMAGEYEVQFRFDETVVLQTDYQPHAPHTTLGREFVEVLAAGGPRALVRERGLNIYTRLQGHDFGPGREYQRKTRAYWAAMRGVWAELLSRNPRVALREEVDETPHYMAVLAQANDLANKPLGDAELRGKVREVLGPYLVLENAAPK
ncbi:hypothetical protein D0B54_11840 [Solimonas sp. K1W22B-7]|uniref:DUF6607 family protein n=1 Tax=Solimonas sp. K1W22B-7 TaxID=2303331 RepID=UPI000E33155B|nr:DUF6607 family protein [Solimonas sp. K1W22B-7]AXQ29340.1 hypothetical protein D0B54_11840 [Solimonas sp. K1W22B-7]